MANIKLKINAKKARHLYKRFHLKGVVSWIEKSIKDAVALKQPSIEINFNNTSFTKENIIQIFNVFSKAKFEIYASKDRIFLIVWDKNHYSLKQMFDYYKDHPDFFIDYKDIEE